MLEIITLKEKHLEDAALLVCNRYQRLCEQESHVPDRYLGVNNLLFLLQNLLKETETGVAAIRGDRLIGFMVGWAMHPAVEAKRTQSRIGK